ncbi:MAG: type II toxin-antitoxin system prevent-host-death family antitoxin [Candidatus Daviesbacteria bacterium]|nr:type II toxin-antitoxin system prevent-host-death family antitoxin [Candidatus Daviesbacteria bacterium]
MLFPRTTTAREIQRNYKKVFETAKRTKEPIFVMKNNKPVIAIIDARKLGEMEAILAVLESREEARQGKVKILKSFKDLR